MRLPQTFACSLLAASKWSRELGRHCRLYEGWPSARVPGLFLSMILLGIFAAVPSHASLDLEVGRSETRVYSAPYPLQVGSQVGEAGIARRLERLGYRRVRGRRPSQPGEFFWGFDHFWIFQREHLAAGQKEVGARLFGLALKRPHGEITGFVAPATALPDGAAGGTIPISRGDFYVEAELLYESLSERRAQRIPVSFGALPEVAWRAVLAAEDGRFFDHGGVDSRGVARALLRNVKAGKVKQGGSTITQQLIKIRELTPKRTLGRKVSEGLRALALEAEYTKEEILQAYLNSVYYGQVEGVSLYGLGAAARAYFGVRAEELDLRQASVLAGIIQSPNRLTPARHPEAARKRQLYVLRRMSELGWITKAEAEAAQLPTLRLRSARSGPASTLRSALRSTVEERSDRLTAGRGVVVRTALDAELQDAAESAVTGVLRRFDPNRQVNSALVAARISDGRIVAYVGGDPSQGSGFDRVLARRQPGSTVKPLVTLEALERCGDRGPLNMASRILDEPITIELPSGPWRPRNSERDFRGEVDVRRALIESLNVPTVRMARWCGFSSVADRFRAFGLDLPEDQPPSFVLGAVEVSPLDILAVYMAIASGGDGRVPVLVDSLELPGGRRLATRVPRGERRRMRQPIRASSAYIVRKALEDVTEGWAADGSWGKTGTSSGGRDAWFAGGVGDLAVVVWVGADRGAGLGLSGRGTAGPIFQAFAEQAVGSYASGTLERPRRVVEGWVEEESGLLLKRRREGGRRELFRRGELPPRKRLFRTSVPEVVE